MLFGQPTGFYTRVRTGQAESLILSFLHLLLKVSQAFLPVEMDCRALRKPRNLCKLHISLRCLHHQWLLPAPNSVGHWGKSSALLLKGSVNVSCQCLCVCQRTLSVSVLSFHFYMSSRYQTRLPRLRATTQRVILPAQDPFFKKYPLLVESTDPELIVVESQLCVDSQLLRELEALKAETAGADIYPVE